MKYHYKKKHLMLVNFWGVIPFVRPNLRSNDGQLLGCHTLCTAEPAFERWSTFGVSYPLYGRTCVRTMVNFWGVIPFVRPNLRSNDGQPYEVSYPLYGRTCVRTMVNLLLLQLKTRILMYKRYVVLSYHLYGRTHVRAYKHTTLGYDTSPKHRVATPKPYRYVRPNPGSAVQEVCRFVIP